MEPRNQFSPPGWESIPGLLKRFTNTGSRKARTIGSLDNWKKNLLEKSEVGTLEITVVGGRGGRGHEE
jgi:hypothetical protein